MSRGRPQPSRHPSKTPSVSPFAFADCSAVSPERCFSCLDLKEVAERPEVQIQISVLEPEMCLQLLHAPVEPHERLADPLTRALRSVRRSCTEATARYRRRRAPRAKTRAVPARRGRTRPG